MDSDLHERLRLYAGDRPCPIRYDELVSVARRKRRVRQVWTGTLTTAAAAALVVGVVTVAAGHPGTSGVPPVANHGGVHHHTTAPPVHPSPPASDQMPDVMRGLVRDYYGDDTDHGQVDAATWAFHPAPRETPPPLDPDSYDKATEWWSYFTRDGGAVGVNAVHFPDDIDDPANKYTCQGMAESGRQCEVWTLPDGRLAMQLTWTVPPIGTRDGDPDKRQSLSVLDGRFEVSVYEYLGDPDGAFRLDRAQLVSLATEPALDFPLPDELPPLPSYYNCYWTDTPSSDCPAT